MKDELRVEIRAELRAEMLELEARLSQSRGPLASDPPPTTQVNKKKALSVSIVNYVITLTIYVFLLFLTA